MCISGSPPASTGTSAPRPSSPTLSLSSPPPGQACSPWLMLSACTARRRAAGWRPCQPLVGSRPGVMSLARTRRDRTAIGEVIGPVPVSQPGGGDSPAIRTGSGGMPGTQLAPQAPSRRIRLPPGRWRHGAAGRAGSGAGLRAIGQRAAGRRGRPVGNRGGRVRGGACLAGVTRRAAAARGADHAGAGRPDEAPQPAAGRMPRVATRSCSAPATGSMPSSRRAPVRWRRAACWHGRRSPPRPAGRGPACARSGASARASRPRCCRPFRGAQPGGH